MKKTEDEKTPPIIVKKIIKKGGGHHGGAWKVAYADFVTAMMAFFLLLWLLNVTTEEQKFAISNYFDPTFPKVSQATSGSGGVMGGTTVSPDGAMTNTTQPISQPDIPDQTVKTGQQNTPNKADISTEEAEEIARQAETEQFKEVENQIRQAVEASEELKELTSNLIMDITEEGLRIQIVDQDKKPMFPSGSAQMYDKTRKLLMLVAKAIKEMPNKISVRGHTDSSAYQPGSTYDNWDLSAERANSSRRALLEGGLAPARISNVLGKADTDPLDKANPMAPINRRISVMVLREEHPKLPAGSAPPPRVQRQTPARTAVPGRWDNEGKMPSIPTTPVAPLPRQGRDTEKAPPQPFRSGGGVLGIPE